MKRLIVCCDGTWSRADQETNGQPCPTNVVKLAFRVAKRDSSDTAQIIYYDQGVGSGNVLDKYSGGAFGDGLEENINEAYRFLIGNYEDGDEIFVFGFSRGAFTARSLCGMVRKCGILKRDSIRHYRDALALYRDENSPTDPKARDFRARHSLCGEQDVGIKFLGVWDTVGSLGIPLRGLRSLTRKQYQFHDTELSGTVQHAYHALSIDERRGPFEPTLWEYKPKPRQIVEQVWFAGVHSDIGGGYPESGLSDLTLDWMLMKAKSAGLTLDTAVVETDRTNGSFQGKLHASKTGFYRLTFGHSRPIGKDSAQGVDPTQRVHESVYRRWDSDPSYRPTNLRRYFAEAGDPRADS